MTSPTVAEAEAGAVPGAATYRDVLAVRPFRRLLAAHSLATLGQLVLTLAVGIEVLDRTGSALGASASVALGFAPYAVCSGLAGVLADRWSRSRALVLSAAVRAVLSTATLGALVAGAAPGVLVALLVATAVAATPAYPALAAACTQCVPDHELPAANALVTGAENALWIAGPGLLGVLTLAGLGPTADTVVATVLLAAGAAAALRAPLPRPPRAPGTPEEVPDDLLAGLRLLRHPGVRHPFVLAVLVNLLQGYLVVHVVLVAPGGLNAALAVGALAALVVVNRLAGSARPWRTLGTSLGVLVVAVVGLGLTGGSALGLVAITVTGAAALVAEVVAVTMLQRASPPHVVARLFGVYDQVNVGAIAVGSLLAGPLAAALGAGPALLAMASGTLVGATTTVLRGAHGGPIASTG